MLNATEVTDGITAGVEVRQQRGMEIAALARIEKVDGVYVVPSVTNPRPTKYKVSMAGMFPTCTCPDHEMRGCKCKHIYAVECVIRRETTVEPNGTTTVRESVTITKTRKTYPQNWPAYNQAQTNEKRQFLTLLHDLCKDLPTPPQTGRGQRRLPMSDAVFAAVFKVYSTMSARRFTSDLCDAQAKGYIEKVPHFNSVLNYLECPDLFPILTGMVERAALPLAAVESTFAVDSTGFCFSRFARWYDVKYNRFTCKQEWVKAHVMCGVKTNAVTAVEIYGKDSGDALHLPALVNTTAANGFKIGDVCADKGYAGEDCHAAIDRVGGNPFIMFKANATGRIGGLFGKMFHYFNYRRDEFLQHYHQRSNVESTVMMVKTKFGDGLKSKTDVAGRNEVLCKLVCHNICCVISAMYELGIQPEF